MPGVVLALFLVLPYSKMVHAVYRSAALLRNALEVERERKARAAAKALQGELRQ